MKHEIAAWTSAVAGACALSIAALWYWRSWEGELTIPPLPGGDMLDFSELFGLALFGLLFQFGVPALSVPAWVLGLKARSDWAARAGMAAAGAAMVMYAVYVRACVRLVTSN